MSIIRNRQGITGIKIIIILAIIGSIAVLFISKVQKSDGNTIAIRRSDLIKSISDLSSILTQSLAVPNREPGTGNINGFRILDFQPGSIYEQLGLQRMDIIKAVDGTPVDSPAKVMELYNTLRNSPKMSLQVERNGKTETMNYIIQ